MATSHLSSISAARRKEGDAYLANALIAQRGDQLVLRFSPLTQQLCFVLLVDPHTFPYLLQFTRSALISSSCMVLGNEGYILATFAPNHIDPHVTAVVLRTSPWWRFNGFDDKSCSCLHQLRRFAVLFPLPRLSLLKRDFSTNFWIPRTNPYLICEINCSTMFCYWALHIFLVISYCTVVLICYSHRQTTFWRAIAAPLYSKNVQNLLPLLWYCGYCKC